MGEWTWLHAVFPLADIELTQPPIDPKVANVLVRTVRRVESGDGGKERYEVRVAPHNVAWFRGGPWVRTFDAVDLETPGAALADFRAKLWAQIEKLL
ncbi:MAG: hypothetical protein K6T83_21300 [Alicyclobacillus sp.]|nr:hypothetical protein [Alicyclobacillus sp.]